MGICSSKIEQNNMSKTMIFKPPRERCFHCKRIKIINESSVHCKILITPTPIHNIQQISIDRIGKVKRIKSGNYLIQNFKILSKKMKKVKLDSSEYYITVYLFIDDEWKCLWECREFTSTSNIHILERHIEEAKLD